MALLDRKDGDEQRIYHRVQELIADGYLIRGKGPNTVMLTNKGLRVLCSLADRPIKKEKLTKTSLAFERQNSRKKDE
jgi:hypothetical protein